jgi:hypothetical protein
VVSSAVGAGVTDNCGLVARRSFKRGGTDADEGVAGVAVGAGDSTGIVACGLTDGRGRITADGVGLGRGVAVADGVTVSSGLSWRRNGVAVGDVSGGCAARD